MLLIGVLLLLCSRTTLHVCFLSFYTFPCVFFFKSSPFFPVFGNVDPDVVVLTLSFKWFLILFFVKVLFEEIVDVLCSITCFFNFFVFLFVWMMSRSILRCVD